MTIGATAPTAAPMSTRARGSTWRGSAPSTVRSIAAQHGPSLRAGRLTTAGAGDRYYGRPVTERIALFPLGHVLLPGAALPLHIFEPRYQAMIADLLATTPPAFGVLSIHRGTETSEDVAFAEVGTMAEIVNRRPYPRRDFGPAHDRFPALPGAGDPALGPALPARRSGVAGGDCRRCHARAGRRCPRTVRAVRRGRPRAVGERTDVTFAAEPVPASYQLAGLVQLTAQGSPDLLAAPTAAHRLHAELVLMRREITLLQQTRTAPIDPARSGSIRWRTDRTRIGVPAGDADSGLVGWLRMRGASVRPRSSRVVKATRRP